MPALRAAYFAKAMGECWSSVSPETASKLFLANLIDLIMIAIAMIEIDSMSI
jgi:hypothetical protein